MYDREPIGRHDPFPFMKGAPWEMRYVILALLYMAAIFYVSTLSGHEAARLARPLGLPDYVLHGIAFAGLAVVWCLALTRGFKVDERKARWLSLGISALYGLTDEYHQSFVAGRDASATDFVADVVGAGTALAIMALFARRKSAKLTQSSG